MIQEHYTLIDEFVLSNLKLRLDKIELDGKTRVTIGNAGDKSSKQRGLQWIWNTDVANSGKGGKHEDTKAGVHLISKYRWCVPILCRDDPFFASLWDTWVQLYNKDPERMEWFVDNQVHTEKLSSSQMGEFLTDYQNHYLSVGIELSDPDEKGLLDFKRAIE